MAEEPRVSAPLWLELSGLPGLLASKIRGGAGWPVFRKIVEMDCDANSRPDTVEVTVDELSLRTGVPAEAVRRALQALRKQKLLACFLPDSDEEAALFRVRMPLPTPLTVEEIRAKWPSLFPDGCVFRYAAGGDADPSEPESEDPLLQEVVDLYFNTVGLKMNAFILDELRLLRQRFPIEQVRRQFRRAQQNEIHALSWVVKELVRGNRKHGENDQG